MNLDGTITIPSQVDLWKVQTAHRLLENSGNQIEEQTAIEITNVLYLAKTDPETNLLLRRMKEGSGQEEFHALAQDLNPAQVVTGLVQTWTDLRK